MGSASTKRHKTLIRDLKKFIQINSVYPYGTGRLARHVGSFLKKEGFRVQYQKTTLKGKTLVNVIGRRGPSGRPLFICAHMDTVPPGNIPKWTKTRRNPWKAVLKGTRLYGLGSADDKGPLVAILHALKGMKPHTLKRPLVIAGTFGEETGMPGAKRLVGSWRSAKPIAALVAEPTNLKITYRHKGVGAIVLEIHTRRKRVTTSLLKKHFRGRQAHSGRPHLGVNALEKAIHYLASLPPERLNGSSIALEGGSAPNIIPDHAVLLLGENDDHKKKTRKESLHLFPAPAVVACYQALQNILEPLKKRHDRAFLPPTLTSNLTVARSQKQTLKLIFDFRFLPGQAVESIYRQFKSRVGRIMSRQASLSARLWIERNNPPLGLKKHHPWPQAGRKLLKKNGLHGILETKPSCTEAGVYHTWGVPAFVMGPGHADGNIHAPNEWISLRQMEQAVHIYREAIRRFCVEGQRCT